MIEWKKVKLNMGLRDFSPGNYIRVHFPTGDGETITVPLFTIKFEEKTGLKTLEEMASYYEAKIKAEIQKMQEELYEAAVADGDGVPPKTAIMFVDEDIATWTYPVGDVDSYAYTVIGIACFDTEVDLSQFDAPDLDQFFRLR